VCVCVCVVGAALPFSKSEQVLTLEHSAAEEEVAGSNPLSVSMNALASPRTSTSRTTRPAGVMAWLSVPWSTHSSLWSLTITH